MIMELKVRQFPENTDLNKKSSAQLKKNFRKSLRLAKKADKLNSRDLGEKHWNKCLSISEELNRRRW